MGTCCSKFISSGNPSPSPENAAWLSPPPPSIESSRATYEKIDPAEQIDQLIRFVENRLQKMNTSSEAGSSSSEGWLETVQDDTKLAAKTIDTICAEAEKLSESDVMQQIGGLTLREMRGLGEVHSIFMRLSVFAADSYLRVDINNEWHMLLLNILELAKNVKQYNEVMPEECGKLHDAVLTIMHGAVICCDLDNQKFWRLWSVPTAAAQLEKTNQQLRYVRQSLRESTRRLHQSPLQLLDFHPVGIEEQVREAKKLLDVDGAESALAVIVCGFGGVGKSTLAASVVQSLDWSSTDFKFCRVAINKKTSDKASHVIKLQKDIISDLGGDKLDLRNPDKGRARIKEALEMKSSFVFIDNVVDKDYIRELLPTDLWSGEQKTKLRILITSGEKKVKSELKILCREYEVNALSDADSERLLFKTIVPGEVVEDEKSMVKEVVVACRGFPLLLSVFGKHLRIERDKKSYQEALEILREGNLDSYRDEDLGRRLMFVYRKINDLEVKEAFLDICTYFHGWKWNLVADIVDIRTLKNLHKRMLVSKSGSDEVIVHDILRLMGMKEASLTRSSNYTEFSDFMEDDLVGLRNVKGILLIRDSRLRTILSTALEAMHQSLRVLMLGDWVTLDGPPCVRAFRNLRYLRLGDIAVFLFKDPSKLDKLRVFLNRSKPGLNLSRVCEPLST